MLKIILTKGLPASGKSTWAKALVKKEPGRWKRINKDDLRAMLDNSKWSKQNEQFVLLMRDTMALSALEHGFSVIIDDTNLHNKHFLRMEEMAKEAKKLWNKDVVVEIESFTDVPLETCIERDLARPNSVGEKVIRGMYNQFMAKKEEYKPDLNLPEAIMCDLDGTLALLNGRDPYDASTCENDLPNIPVVKVVLQFRHLKLICVSGREDKYREQTVRWLEKTLGYKPELYMRKAGDMRKDSIVKRELFDANIRDKYRVIFVLDDRNQVVEMWRNMGITCLQVADGDF